MVLWEVRVLNPNVDKKNIYLNRMQVLGLFMLELPLLPAGDLALQ